MNLKFMRCVSARERAIRPFVIVKNKLMSGFNESVLLLTMNFVVEGPHGNIFHLNKSLNAHTTVWSAFSGRSSSTSQENYVQDVQDAWPVWSLSHGFTVAFLNINGVDSIYYFQRPALVCTVFLHGKIKRTKRPCAYYSNSSATFHCTLEGDLVFKLNPGPVNNGHCTQGRHASIDRMGTAIKT